MFDFFRKKPKQNIRKPTEYILEDYTPLLGLINVDTCGVEEVYTRTLPCGVKIIYEVLELPTGGADCIKNYGSEYQCFRRKELAEDLLKEAVLPVINGFYEKHRGKLVVYSPLDTIEHYNTISEGWYLMYENGKFTLYCNYRVFKQEEE